MLCDKADCNYYDSSMEYNCAWGNDGSSSIMCMTHDYKRYCQRPLTSKSGYVEGVNYKKLYEHEKNLHALAVARFRAGEAYIKSIEYTHGNTPLQESRRDYLIIAIAAYDAAVKGEGE